MCNNSHLHVTIVCLWFSVIGGRAPHSSIFQNYLHGEIRQTQHNYIQAVVSHFLGRPHLLPRMLAMFQSTGYLHWYVSTCTWKWRAISICSVKCSGYLFVSLMCLQYALQSFQHKCGQNLGMILDKQCLSL